MTRARSIRRKPPALSAILSAYPDIAATVAAMQQVFGPVTLTLVDEDGTAPTEQAIRSA